MLRVGLTGGTGAGKSTVAARFAALGAVVVDADELAREVVAPGSAGLAEVAAEFGDDVLTTDGSLDRPALARVVFADADRRRTLEAITHPRIAALTAERVAAAPSDAVVVHDVPLLVERAMGDRYHLVVVVEAPEETRVARLVASRGMTAEDARARVRAQATDPERRAAADVLLPNDAGPADVLARVDVLWRERLVPFERNLRERTPAVVERGVVVPADPRWPQQAARLLARVATVTGAEVLRADHVGSTSVPGLAAKDVVDLQLVVPDLRAAARVVEAVAAVGLLVRPEDWWDEPVDWTPPSARHAKVMVGSADPVRPVDLHVREVASPAWRETLALRDWLRAHPEQAAEYAVLERAVAAGDHDGIDDDARRRTAWIRGAVHRARAAGLSP